MEIIKWEDSERIFFLSAFEPEKKGLYGKSIGQQREYDRWLKRKLHDLDVEPLHELLLREAFEKLQYQKMDIYAIRRPHVKGNPRTLFFVVTEEGEETSYILLTAFFEKNKGDYDRGISRAYGRANEALRQLEEG